ncbi:MAG TPA: type II toxin-antitoxin system prevent-host-death family antitoxin [Candidatus Elarobacter sp.]|jgi:prevent-host-death family protein|nr:type II toxin-antitoxin system prevent-host-death family antitoxin [Candidatus Elarobacter sp.]
MHEAKSTLSSLVRRVREGNEREIVICLAGQPAAKLVPLAETPRRRLGVDHGLITIAPDFDAVNDEIASLFEGP